MDSTESNIRYRSEYHYNDGEFAYQIEGDNESYLSMGHARRLDALPLIRITTIHISKTTKERSEEKNGIEKNKKTENSTKTKHYGESEDGVKDRTHSLKKGDHDTLPEDLQESVPSHTYMTIHSKELLNVLRDVISYYPGYSLLTEELRVPEPYRILCLHREELRAYKSKYPQWHAEAYRVECNRQLDVLLQFLDNRYGKAVQDEKIRWARKVPVCTFEYLWLLYKPGEVCYLDDFEGKNPYITQKLLQGGRVGRTAYTYKIEMWNIGYDGYEVGGCSHTASIAPFDGEKEIGSKELPAKTCIKGQNILGPGQGGSVLPPVQWTNSNISIQEGDPTSGFPSLIALTQSIQQVSGRVVVDPLSYFNRYDFERSDINSDDSSSPSIKDGNYGGDREPKIGCCGTTSTRRHLSTVENRAILPMKIIW